MLINRCPGRAFKDEVYASFATITKAMASARRLELLDLLVQGKRSVEDLSRGVGQPIASASQHLQILKRARLVLTERKGTRVEYRLAPGVAEVFVALRRLAEDRSPLLQQTKSEFFHQAGAPATIDHQELNRRQALGQVTLVDVRPRGEFNNNHIEGALSMPIDVLEDRLDELPTDDLIVATCRGPYCVFATEAVQILRKHGRRAVRFEGGVADWAFDGGSTSQTTT